MKKILFVLFLFIQYNSFAQGKYFEDDYASNEFRHTLFYNNTLYSNISNPGWRNFVDTYNAYSTPTEKLNDFRNHFSFDLGYRFGNDKINASIMWQHTTERCEAVYQYDEIRRFDYQNNAAALGLNVRFAKLANERLSFYGVANMRFGGMARIVSSFIYRDGTQSYGSEKDLNGTYLNAGTLGAEFGLNVSYRIVKGLKIEIQFLRQSNNRFDTGGNWGDNGNFKILNAASSFGLISLPEDYNTYYTQGPGNYTGKFVQTNFRGNKLTVGLSYTFNR